MDQRRQEWKKRRKAYKKAKRKYISPWRGLCVLFLVLAVVSAPLTVAAKRHEKTVADWFGADFWRLSKEDAKALYYTSDFETPEQLAEHAKEIYKQAACESAVLLMNNHKALPLTGGSQIRLVFDSGENPLNFRREELETALQKAGFTLSDGETDVAVVCLSGVPEGETSSLLQRAAETSEKLVVLLCTDSLTRADFLMGDACGIDAALLLGSVIVPDAVAQLLSGKDTPSGRLPYTQTVAAQSVSPETYGGVAGENMPENALMYTLTREGIYTGYKYFETRYEDYVMGTGNAGNFLYSDHVVFPFGYGLSYTIFTYSDMTVEHHAQTGKLELSVTVTNTGAVAGKEVVQVYAQTPYTDYDRENGIEKPSVSLVGMAKTKLLAPGDSEKVTVLVNKGDMFSYDTMSGAYRLDAGNYYLTVARDAHAAVNNILAAKECTPESTEYRMTMAGDATLTYRWEQLQPETKESQNRLSFADPNGYTGITEETKWLSRRDWASSGNNAPKPFQLTQKLLADMEKTQYSPGDYPSVPMPTLGAQNGLTLYDMVGLAFDDPQWQTLLDQLTFRQMQTLLSDADRVLPAVDGVEAPGVRYGYGSVATLAASFDTELMYELGTLLGNFCLQQGVFGLQISGAASEDAFLAGKTCAGQVLGVQSKGVIALVEGPDLGNVALWQNEQTAREQNLRFWQYALQESNAKGMMAENHRLGAQWSGSATEQMQDILRQEWGYTGIVLCDSELAAQMSYVDGVMAGVTGFGTQEKTHLNQLKKYENDPVVVSAMRKACHYHLYAVANSAAMNGIGEDTSVRSTEIWPVTVLAATFAASVVMSVVFGILWYRGKKKREALL
ncbi:MAG: fibronectin type III-like domain-contianing protein [Oscillospiraceae bacterium]|nr:fibronectin type III-like domain-contianing protein [Oscillospiraceae bacterium]